MTQRGRSNMLDALVSACFVAAVAWLLRPPARDQARELEDKFYAEFGRAYLRGDDLMPSGESDREILETVLHRAGFGWRSKADAIELVAKEGRVGGYSGFVAVFEFNAESKLTAVEVWE